MEIKVNFQKFSFTVAILTRTTDQISIDICLICSKLDKTFQIYEFLRF